MPDSSRKSLDELTRGDLEQLITDKLKRQPIAILRAVFILLMSIEQSKKK